MNLFKVRASYGSLGNQDVGAFGHIPAMSAGQGGYIINGELPTQVSSPGLASANYTWETVITKNLGVDLGFYQQPYAGGYAHLNDF